ncbi:hypothetical protein LOTGIDRAFT_228920 [Lottia gigantea]|uniref:Uncharacterized protein n=1 Tax=Lottia gigantea TaxID=225164 RepID=V3ZX66_LOTGI|nr:hypothetical protein LOTGIDRAFT_228920 [Lottia gigantea]ESO88962.1 hypothetical protein LOTGIDRAFT_228920 [Lottia gigantea]
MSASREQAKQYLANHKIPQLFESLLSCLMIERPADPVAYLETKMAHLKDVGLHNINWETFVMHLHPYRDPVRLSLVRDGSKYESEMMSSGDSSNNSLNSTLNTSSDSYKPELFQLTETQS